MMKWLLRKARRSALSPAPPGYGDFFATAHVALALPLPDPDDPDGDPARGYYRNFGIRAAPDRVPVVLAEAVKDGTIQWADTEWHAVEPASLDRAIRARVKDVEGEGIWYERSCTLYTDPDPEPPAH